MAASEILIPTEAPHHTLEAINAEIVENTHQYRNYIDSERQDIVTATYKLNHTLQTVGFVKKMKEEHLRFNKGKMSIWKVIELLDELVDDSDPDVNFPQIYHALQAAEALREQCPQIEWLPLVGLIHDLGKIIALPEYGNLPQWAVVGDTFPVGCKFSPKICMYHLFEGNPDNYNPEYNTEYGMYSPGCGIDNLEISWGHDEYLYQVCLHNKSTIPIEGLKAIRYHSFYAWHNENEYSHLCNEEDKKTLEWVKMLNKADLYSKVPVLPDPEKLKPFYQNLIEKYFPTSELEW